MCELGTAHMNANENTPPRKYNRYDEAFQRSTVELWMLSGKSARQVALELGLNVQSLQKWKQKFKALPAGQVAGTLAAGLQRSEAAFVAGVSGAGGVRGALARSGRGYAPPCARQRVNPETMNQNSHCTWIKKWGLASIVEGVIDALAAEEQAVSLFHSSNVVFESILKLIPTVITL